MSISPPSDIVLDVARAADPVRYREAVARLGNASPTASAEFQTAMAAETPKTVAVPRPPTAAITPRAEPKPEGKAEKANRDFETMVLANLLEAAMPDDGAALFGEGTAGSVWKSMLVEQIAGQMAKSGGIGIAAQIARGSQAALADDKSDPVASRDATRSLLVDQVQRGFIGRPADDGGKNIKL